MRYRLDLIAPELVDHLLTASDGQLRRVATGAVELALARTALGGKVEDAQVALQHGRFGDTPERKAIRALTDELDGIQWEVQDKARRTNVPNPDYVAAFAQARAAACLSEALDESVVDAALESLYEANAAVNDLDELKAMVASATRH